MIIIIWEIYRGKIFVWSKKIALGKRIKKILVVKKDEKNEKNVKEWIFKRERRVLLTAEESKQRKCRKEKHRENCKNE